MSWWGWPPVGGLMDQELVYSSWTTEPAACSISCTATCCSLHPNQLVKSEVAPLEDDEGVAAGSVQAPGWRGSTCSSPRSSSKALSADCTVSSRPQRIQAQRKVVSHALSFTCQHLPMTEQPHNWQARQPAPGNTLDTCSSWSDRGCPTVPTRPLAGWISLLNKLPAWRQMPEAATNTHCDYNPTPDLITLLGTDDHADIVTTTSAYIDGSICNSGCSSKAGMQSRATAPCTGGSHKAVPRQHPGGACSSCAIVNSAPYLSTKDKTLVQSIPVHLPTSCHSGSRSSSRGGSPQDMQVGRVHNTGGYEGLMASSDDSSSDSSSCSCSEASRTHPLLRSARAPHPLGNGSNMPNDSLPLHQHRINKLELDRNHDSSDTDSTDTDSSSSDDGGNSSDSDGTGSDATSIDSDHRAWRRQRRQLLLELSLAVWEPGGTSQRCIALSPRTRHCQDSARQSQDSSSSGGTSNSSSISSSAENSYLETALQIQVHLDSHTLAAHNALLYRQLDWVQGRQGMVPDHVCQWLRDSIAATQTAFAAGGGPNAAAVLAARVARLSLKLRRQCLHALHMLRSQWSALGAMSWQLGAGSCRALYAAYLRAALSLGGACIVRRRSVELVTAHGRAAGPRGPHDNVGMSVPGRQATARKLQYMEGWSLPHACTVQHTRQVDESGSDSDCSSDSDTSIGGEAPAGLSVLSLTQEEISQLVTEAIEGGAGCVTRLLHDNALMRVTAYAVPLGMQVGMRKALPWPCTLHVLQGALNVHLSGHQVSAARGRGGPARTQGVSMKHTGKVAAPAMPPALSATVEAEANSGCSIAGSQDALDIAQECVPTVQCGTNTVRVQDAVSMVVAGAEQEDVSCVVDAQQPVLLLQAPQAIEQQQVDTARSSTQLACQQGLQQQQEEEVRKLGDSSTMNGAAVDSVVADSQGHRHSSSRADNQPSFVHARQGSIVSVPQGGCFTMAYDLWDGYTAQSTMQHAQELGMRACSATVAVVLMLVMKV